jgi:NAD+ diphosphatase
MPTDSSPEFERAAELRSDLAYLEAQLEHADSLFLPLWTGHIFVDAHTQDETRVTLLHRAQLGDLLDRSDEVIWLGRYQGRSCFALDVSSLRAPESHAALSGKKPLGDARYVLSQLPPGQLEIALYGRALVLWHARHRFCSVCGHESRPRQGGHQRVCARESCKAEHFPRTDPCVLVLVCSGDKCLLARSKGWPAGMYSALAGFVEPGESLEQATRREVQEEVSVQLGALRYAGSQPWPFPASLMVGFVAEAASTELRVDEHELEAARWVTREELQNPRAHGFFVPPPFAIAGKLIAAFAAGNLERP